jgi:hypothetical protein
MRGTLGDKKPNPPYYGSIEKIYICGSTRYFARRQFKKNMWIFVKKIKMHIGSLFTFSEFIIKKIAPHRLLIKLIKSTFMFTD